MNLNNIVFFVKKKELFVVDGEGPSPFLDFDTYLITLYTINSDGIEYLGKISVNDKDDQEALIWIRLPKKYRNHTLIELT